VTGGWWRRNRWGLVALVPAAALALALPVQHAYAQYWKTEPRTPVVAGADGWVSFAGARVHLDSFAEQTKFSDDFGSPVAVPAGLSVWRAAITFRGTDPAGLAGCLLTMSDVDGATYAANAAELIDLGVGLDFASCAPDPLADKAPAQWTTVAYFVAPKTARAKGVRITLAAQLPRYAWLIAR
jgi:hypothetical protein